MTAINQHFIRTNKIIANVKIFSIVDNHRNKIRPGLDCNIVLNFFMPNLVIHIHDVLGKIFEISFRIKQIFTNTADGKQLITGQRDRRLTLILRRDAARQQQKREK